MGTKSMHSQFAMVSKENKEAEETEYHTAGRKYYVCESCIRNWRKKHIYAAKQW
jgi:hypothetical protein